MQSARVFSQFRRKSQLNYNVLKNNTLDDIRDPQDTPCLTPVVQSHVMQRDSNTFEFSSVAKSKNYKLVYSKRVMNPDTLLTYPYGYVQDEEPLPQCTLTWFANTDFMWEAP